MVQHSCPYMTTGKTIAFSIQNFVSNVMSLLFNNTLSRFVTAFLPRSKHLLISWLHSSSVVILEPKKIKSVTTSTFPFLFVMKWWDQMPWSLFFKCWSQPFHSPLSPSSRGSLVPLCFLPLEWYICISEVDDISPHNLGDISPHSLWFLLPGTSCDVLCIDVK